MLMKSKIKEIINETEENIEDEYEKSNETGKVNADMIRSQKAMAYEKIKKSVK